MNHDAVAFLYDQQETKILEDYKTFLRFPSISSEPEYQPEMKKCVAWVSDYLQKIGFKTELWQTSGHPTLFACNMDAGKDKPTLLIYNHYDVQPVDPLELWESPPFEPSIRHGQIYARGAQDNKGQCFYVLQALRLLKEANRRFPINIKLCIEGEEECGSAGLDGILKQHADALKADYLAVVDLGMPEEQTPAVTLGIRGIATLDVEAIGSNTDLHSGTHGGVAYNPIRALVEVLSSLYEPSGRVAIPGFYDGILPVDEQEKCVLNLTFDEKKYEAAFGTKPTGGERNLPVSERNWLQPTLEINGITGGYTGSGFKTVIPARASAKISCRLVPGQDPEKTVEKVAAFIESKAPEGVTIKACMHHGGGKAVRSQASGKGVQAFAKAFSDVFATDCQFIFEGASIPIVTNLALTSGAEVILCGLALVGDCIHAPNEHFGLDRLKKGCLVIANAIQRLS